MPIAAQLALIVLVLFATSLVRAADTQWPQFRGPAALGTADNPDLPDTWSSTDNIAWKQDTPGRGWSSPIVWGDRVFVTTVTNDEEVKNKDRKRGLYLGGNRDEPSKSEHQWRVLCLDLNDGRVLWEQVAHTGLPPESSHLKNSYASETPVTDGERLYVYFGNLGVFCYALDGEPLWSRTLGTYKTASGWGTGGSPAIFNDRLYVLNDNEDQSFLSALDTKTGAEMWRTPRPEKSSWSTPFVWNHADRTEIVVSGSGAVRSYDLDGKMLWQLGDMSGNAIPTPMAGPNLLYVSSGYFMGNKKPIVAVRPGASGDITLAPDATSNDFVAWCQRKAAPYNPSILLYKGLIYSITDLGLTSCFDAQTGAALYEKKRLPNAKAVTASPWAYNGQVFCLSEYGETFVIKAGPDFEVVRVNSLADDDMCLATPAIAGDKLLLRSDRRLYAVQKSAKIAAGKAE
ncbi:MAG TPA: PQQ-binding-like beta-propeller repeat protein [Pirellulales bacterium]|jgi:outer membrane protein assembly factor BamB